MSSYYPSDTARKLIAILNNAKELSINHSRRNLAVDSINSCKILCKSRKFNIPENIFDFLIYSIKNHQRETLLKSFQKVEEYIIVYDSE